MATPAYLKAFRDFIDSSPQFSHLPMMENEFYLGSDRNAVILQASNIEDTLASAISAKMRRPLSSDVVDRIFDGNGPLSTFSARILMGYALDLYGPIFRHDLDLIRELSKRICSCTFAISPYQPGSGWDVRKSKTTRDQSEMVATGL